MTKKYKRLNTAASVSLLLGWIVGVGGASLDLDPGSTGLGLAFFALSFVLYYIAPRHQYPTVEKVRSDD